MIRNVAYLSMHTSPLLQPGMGDAGGMNVYIHELALTMARRGINVVVFTRRIDEMQPTEVRVEPHYTVVHLSAGPPTPLSIGEMAAHVGEFADGVTKWLDRNGSTDIVHSHYWLSGWAGVLVKEALGVPLVNSFHTLGRVKDLTRRMGEPASSPMRTLTELEVIAQSNCVIASTPYEFDDLVEHYGASLESLCTSPPGIDHAVFTPGDKAESRRWLGMPDGPIVLFVGRIQALKGLDIAVEALQYLDEPDPAHLVIVGGPSGPDGVAEVVSLHGLADRLGVSERLHFVAPQAHRELVAFYRAADVLVMPSRSETFGLVAAEAQACGLPVVAARVGGLPYVVDDGVSGFLVEGHDPLGYAAAIGRILVDPELSDTLRAGAVKKAEEFSWPATADRLLELYSGVSGL